jgi:hypothetical protein
MTLDTTIMAFGVFVAALPFLQFPQDWTDFFAFIAGVVIVGLGVVVRRRSVRTSHEQPQLFDRREPSPEEGTSDE